MPAYKVATPGLLRWPTAFVGLLRHGTYAVWHWCHTVEMAVQQKKKQPAVLKTFI